MVLDASVEYCLVPIHSSKKAPEAMNGNGQALNSLAPLTILPAILTYPRKWNL
jgi:hypothetical protein